MVAYLVNQIILGKLTYLEVTTARSDLRDKIDTYIEDKSLIINEIV
jgi:hypothetical protein